MDVLSTKLNLDDGCIKYQWPYPKHDQDSKPHSGTSSILRSHKSRLKGHGCFCTFKIKIESQKKIKMPNPSQEHPASSKAYNHDLKYMDNLCTFKTEIERQHLKHWCVKDQWGYPNQDQDDQPWSGASIVLKSSKSGLPVLGCSLHLHNQYRDILCTLIIKIVSQSSELWCIKMPNSVRNLQLPPKLQVRTERTGMFFTPSKSR